MFYDHHIRRHLRMARHHGGRGFGHFFMEMGSGGPGWGGRAFRLGRKLGAVDLQLLVLALLAEKPSHGYELIKALEERSGGFYSPSPGMIYPALTYLEEIGHATVEAEGTKKRYHITDEGRAYLQQHRSAADAMLAALERIGGRMEHIRRAFAGESPAGPSERRGAGERSAWSDPRAGSQLHAARDALRTALHDKRHCSAEETARIAEILHRAAAAIRGE